MRHPAPPRPQQVEFLLDPYRHALAAADPMKVLPPHLPEPPRGRTVVVGMGKAAAAMDDLVIALISGGGSALCALPAQGISLAQKQAITQALLLRGATIAEMNTVRKHLSAIKGGRLAMQAWPARVVSLLISDIPGDDPALIASAPTLADASSCADALHVLDRHAVELSAPLRSALAAGALESPKPQDARFAAHSHAVIACAQDGLEAAAQAARRHGWTAHVLSDSMEGEARELAKAHAAIAMQVQRRGQPFEAPCVLLSAGEATVTDGLDGNSGAAGAWISPATLQRARACARTPQEALLDNDSGSLFEAVDGLVITGSLFEAVDGLVITGPTLTNINDFRAVIVEAA